VYPIAAAAAAATDTRGRVQAGRTALYLATQRGQTSIVEMLVDKFHANVSSRSNDGSTLMHVAAMCGNAETAMAMLKKGVPINMPNKVLRLTSVHSHLRSDHRLTTRKQTRSHRYGDNRKMAAKNNFNV